MKFSKYQREGWRFDQQGANHAAGLTVSLLGLGGEVGDLLTSQKKRVRDRVTPSAAHEVDTEAIGDILWYLSVTAARLGVDLDAAAAANLQKVADRWPPTDTAYPSATQATAEAAGIAPAIATLGSARVFDVGHRAEHRLPRQFRVILAPDLLLEPGRVRMVWNGQKFGDPLSDNAVEPDWYRYHDAFHLAYAAVLGWSPLFRLLGHLKRKDVPLIDEVEDGGRAIAIEEGIAAFMFEEGRRNDWFEFGQAVPGDALALCRRLTSRLESRTITAREWERAILTGFECWRAVVEQGRGVLVGDLDARTLVIERPSEAEMEEHRAVCEREADTRTARES